MKETSSTSPFQYPLLDFTCVCCLKVVHEVCPMSNNLIMFYENLVSAQTTTMKTESTYHFCYICGHVLKKFLIFTQQCLRAQEYLVHTELQDSSKVVLSNTVYNLSWCRNEIHDFVQKKQIKEETLDVDTAAGASYDNDNCLSTCGSDEENKDDNTPLLMLKRQNTAKLSDEISADDKKNINNLLEVKSEPEFEYEIETKTKRRTKKNKKKKKILKEGFTSRMVQETDEYIVIKLTKEQVSQEMAERSKTEHYTRYPYKCELCIKGFNFADVLKNHMECHNEKRGPLKCELCSQYCPNAVSLRGHMKSHTTRYKCKMCEIVRPSRQHLLDHYFSTHHAGNMAATYSCSYCQYTTSKRTTIQKHAKSHKQTDGLTCELCGKTYLSKESFRVHMLRHDNKKLKCPLCLCTFVYSSSLRRHVASVHADHSFYCVECDKTFKSEDTLNAHFRRSIKHRDSKTKMDCPECMEEFFSFATLDSHLNKIHGVLKGHACSFCPRKYSTRLSLNVHVKTKHDPGSANYTCDICQKNFPIRFLLVRHLRSHSLVKPYTCHCGAAYTQQSRLKQHITTKHKPPVDDK